MSVLGFAILAGLIIAGALVVVLSENIVHAAVALAFTFFFVAGLYVLLGSPLLAVIQFAVNAAAIPILTLFIIMTTQSRRIRPASGVFYLVAGFLALVFLVGLWGYLGAPETGHLALHGLWADSGSSEIAFRPLGPEGLGVRLLTVTLLPFEVASVLLLLAMVGAVVLARRREE